MSTYTVVYLRKGNTFAQLSATGRSAARSEMLEHYAPDEQLCRLQPKDIKAIIYEYTQHLHDWQERVRLYEARKATVASFTNTTEEKLQALDVIDNEIDEINDTIAELQDALFFMQLLDDIADFSDITGVYVYVGIEVGYSPTPADIQGGEDLTPEQIAGPTDED